jgi:hypothetical protein
LLSLYPIFKYKTHVLLETCLVRRTKFSNLYLLGQNMWQLEVAAAAAAVAVAVAVAVAASPRWNKYINYQQCHRYAHRG